MKKKSINKCGYGIFNGQALSGNYCTFDQSFRANQQNSNYALNRIECNNLTQITNTIDFINLAKLLPAELRRLINNAAQQGLLISMLITLTNTMVTDYLKHLNYQLDKIYLINQVILALLLIAIGASVDLAIATPMMGHMLHSYCNFSKEISNYITTSIALGIHLLTNTKSFMQASLAISISVGTGLAISKLTKASYNFVRNTFFRTQEEPEENTHDFQFV